MKKRTLILSAGFLISQIALGGVLFGTVTDKSGKPVKDAKVRVWGKDLDTKTNAKGEFKFDHKDLAVGNSYSVKVNVDGYNASQPLRTEIFEDIADMEPLEIEIEKEKEIVISTNNTYVRSMMVRPPNTNATPNKVEAPSTEQEVKAPTTKTTKTITKKTIKK